MGPGVSSGNPLPVGCEESVVAYPTAVTAGQLQKLPGFRRWRRAVFASVWTRWQGEDASRTIHPARFPLFISINAREPLSLLAVKCSESRARSR